MVALSSLSLPAEAWKSARILRAIPNCRLVLMMSYHFLSPALSVEENGLMAYLQTPPEAGPSVTQVTTGLQNWKCAGRRLVEIGGRLPTSTQLHQAFVKILSKHLTSNKKVNFVFQQQSRQRRDSNQYWKQAASSGDQWRPRLRSEAEMSSVAGDTSDASAAVHRLKSINESEGDAVKGPRSDAGYRW